MTTGPVHVVSYALSPEEAALVRLGSALKEAGYSYVTVTPETHRRVSGRPENAEARDLRDVFGWSRPFHPSVLPRGMLDLMAEAGVLSTNGALHSSAVRFSSLGQDLLVHSAFPTLGADTVFFGPDTYRFVRLLQAELSGRQVPWRCADIGCGSGAGGIALARLAGREDEPAVTHIDVNREALRYARINASLAGLSRAEFVESDILATVPGAFDLIVSNPPYLADPAHRTYRDGGGSLGLDLSLRIVSESAPRLAPGERLILYTGVAIIEGRDPFEAAVRDRLAGSDVHWTYREIDPDVFGEELGTPAYRNADRIAAVSLVVRSTA